jgi:hypothetical protein
LLLTSAATITQQTTVPTPQQRRESVYLGKMGHGNRTSLINAFNEPDLEVSPLSQLRDMFTPIKLINENVYPSPNTGLTFNTSSGTLWGLGIGFLTNKLNPSSLSVSGNSPTTFQYRTQTGGTATNRTTIDPANYDLNGVITAIGVPAKQATNQRIYLLQNGQFRLQYGQTKYTDLTLAIAAVTTEVFTTFSNFRDNAILIGILSIRSDATLLTDPLQAKITFASKFGESVGGTGGISTTTLQQAYDNSTDPEILINSTLDGLSIKNGTGNADNVTRLLEGINAAGNATSFIRADGDISGTTLQTNGFTGNTNGMSALTVNIRTIGSGTSITNLGIDVNGNVVSGVTGNGGSGTFTGGTVTGPTIFTSGVTANTISATTYYNLPVDVYSTGGTYNGSNLIITNNTGGTFTVTGLTATGFSANYYGSFSDTTNQQILTADTPTVWTYNTTEISNGISIIDNSKIKVSNKGVYEIGYSAQIEKTGIGTATDVTIWARINGFDVLRSSSTLSFANNNAYQLPFVSFIFELEANDYVEFYFSSPSTNVQITTLSGLTSPTRPIAPSVIIVAKQVGLAVSAGGTGDTFVTGFTYDNYNINLTQNTQDQYSAFTITITGFTTTDIFVTGGTYSNGNTTFTNNSGGTFTVTGFYTGTTDVFVTGGTYSSGDTTITFTNNTGGTFTVTGITSGGGGGGGTSVTGGTFNYTTNTLTLNNSDETSVNITGLTDTYVTGGTYTSGNAIFTNNTGGTFTVTGFAVGSGGGQLFYLNLSETKNGNRYLSTTASTAAEQSTGVTINNGVTATIASFQSDQLNAILIPGGIWSFHLHSYKSTSNASFLIFVEVYKRTSGGTETLLFTTESVPVTNTSPNPTMQISEAYFSGSPIVVTDSIVAVVRATNTSNQIHTITFFTEGSQYYSYAISTLQTQQGLTCDTLSGCSVIQTIQTDISNKFDKSGGTITGDVLVQNGLTATTISATTYQGLPLTNKGDIFTFSTVNTRLGVGANGTILMADSAATTGNKWVALSGDVTINTSGKTTIKPSVAASSSLFNYYNFI